MTHYKLKHEIPKLIEAKQIFISGSIEIPEEDYVDGQLVSTKRFLPFDYGDYIIEIKKNLKLPMKREIFEYLYRVEENDSKN